MDKDVQSHFIAKKRYVREKELVKLLPISVHALRMDRYKKKGLPYHRISGKILYNLAEVEQYLEETKVTPEKR